MLSISRSSSRHCFSRFVTRPTSCCGSRRRTIVHSHSGDTFPEHSSPSPQSLLHSQTQPQTQPAQLPPFSDIARNLLEGDRDNHHIQYFVCDRFLESLGQESLLQSLHSRLRQMDTDGELKFVLNQISFRTDRVKWIEKRDSQSELRTDDHDNDRCFDDYMSIMLQLQSGLFTAMNEHLVASERPLLQIAEMHDTKRMEVMASCYPSNSAHYDRHIDDAKGTFNRIVTCCYYLSDRVSEEVFRGDTSGGRDGDGLGGHLRLYPASKHRNSPQLQQHIGEPHIDVAPIRDRLVMFSSRDTPHEVRPTFHRRYALSMWLYGHQALSEEQLDRVQGRKL